MQNLKLMSQNKLNCSSKDFITVFLKLSFQYIYSRQIMKLY